MHCCHPTAELTFSLIRDLFEELQFKIKSDENIIREPRLRFGFPEVVCLDWSWQNIEIVLIVRMGMVVVI